MSPPLALPPVGGIEGEEVLVLVPPPPPAERETGLDKVVLPPPLPAAPAAPPAPPVPTVKVKVSPDASDDDWYHFFRYAPPAPPFCA